MPLRSRLRFATLPLALAVPLGLALCPAAHAQSDADRATARSLGQDGQQALESKDYATAEDRFRRADKMVHAPTLMLGLARSLAAEGKYVEAQEAYNRIVREGVAPGAPDAFKRAVEDAKKEVDAVAAKVGAVTITVKTSTGVDIPDPQVVLDEHPINSASLGVRRAINPGTHVVRATAQGYKTGEATFTVTAGGGIDEPILLEQDTTVPSPSAPVPATTPGATAAAVSSNDAEGSPAPSSARKIAPWVAFGVGGVGLAVGAVTGILAVGKHSSLSDSCKNGCGPAQQGDLDSYHTLGTLSTVGFVVAVAGGATGAILLLTEPKGRPVMGVRGVRVVPVVGLGSIGAAGSF